MTRREGRARAEPAAARASAWRSAGQYASQQEAFRALLIVLALAAVSVVAVMVIQFRSFVEPLIVAARGAGLVRRRGRAAAGSRARRSTFRRFMGLILLVGLIVKNGIILLDFTRHRMRHDGRARSSTRFAKRRACVCGRFS